jgi:Ca2+-binding EF-hand superfamily protein
MEQLPGDMRSLIDKTVAEVLRLNTTRLSRRDLENQAISGYRAAKACDADNSGTMSTEEIVALCRRLGLPVDDGDDAIDSMDADGSGVLDIGEVVQWWIKRTAAVPGTYIHAKKMAAIDFTPEQRTEIDYAIEKALADPKNLSSEKELNQQANAAFRAAKASDADGNEIITTSEIEELTEKLGLPMGEGADDTILSMDQDGSGRLEMMEFVLWWIRRVSRLPGTDKQQEIIAKNTFKNFDKDNSGTITSAELVDIVSSLGVNFSDEELEEALAELDTDRSGSIDQNEFMEWWMNRANSVRPGASLIAYKLKKIAQKAAQVFYTDIHTAAWKGDIDLVKMFLDATPLLCNAGDVNEHGDGWTPLQYAAYQGHLDIVAEMLNRTNDKKQLTCNIDLQNDLRFTALFYAAQRKHLEIVALLLEKGADPSICGDHHVDPDIHVCPADHAQDCEELRELFMQNPKCVVPLEVDIGDITASINSNGLVVIELPSPATVEGLSTLPLTKWRIRLDPTKGRSGGSSDEALEVVVSASRANTASRQKCELELPKRDAELFLQAATDENCSITVAARNAIGEGPFSTPLSVTVSNVTPRRMSRGGSVHSNRG